MNPAFTEFCVGGRHPLGAAKENELRARPGAAIAEVGAFRAVADLDGFGFAPKREAHAHGQAGRGPGIRRQAQAARARVAAGIGRLVARGPRASAQEGFGLLGPGAHGVVLH